MVCVACKYLPCVSRYDLVKHFTAGLRCSYVQSHAVRGSMSGQALLNALLLSNVKSESSKPTADESTVPS